MFAEQFPANPTKARVSAQRGSLPDSRTRARRSIGDFELLGRWGEGPAQAVAVAGGYAYLGTGTVLSVLDVSDPGEPRLIGKTETGGRVLQIVLQGNRAYLATGPQGLRIFDVSNRTTPKLQAVWPTRGSVTKINIWGNIAYLAESGQGVRAIDVSTPGVPFEVGFFPNPQEPVDIERYENYLYVLSEKQIAILRADPGGRLVEAGAQALEEYTYDLAVSGSHLVSADWGKNPRYPYSVDLPDGSGGLHIWSVSDPTHLFPVAALDVTSFISSSLGTPYPNHITLVS